MLETGYRHFAMSPPSKRSSRKDDRDDDERHDRKRRKEHKSSRSRKTDDVSSDEEFDGEIIEISDKDYFNKAPQFRMWLKLRKKFMDELSSDESHKLFSKFVRRWNKGSLPASIYLAAANDQSVRASRHKWDFSKNLDKREIDKVRTDVSKANYVPSGMNHPGCVPVVPTAAVPLPSKRTYGPVIPTKATTDTPAVAPVPATQIQFGPVRPPRIVRDGKDKQRPSAVASSSSSAMSERERVRHREDAKERDRRQQKAERKAQRRLEKERMDELVPPPSTAHEARQEKRRQRAYDSSQRGQSPELRDSSMMGTSNDYESAIRQQEKEQKNRQRKKSGTANARLEELKAKEERTMAALKEMASKYYT